MFTLPLFPGSPLSERPVGPLPPTVPGAPGGPGGPMVPTVPCRPGVPASPGGPGKPRNQIKLVVTIYFSLSNEQQTRFDPTITNFFIIQ